MPAPSHAPPATTGTHIGAVIGAVDAPQGLVSHVVFNIPRGRPAVSFQTSSPPPASCQYNSMAASPSPPPALSPFAHASQLLFGLGQTHPSISFPQFMGENPNLWKTFCEQYFEMFGILPSFWVPMAALNFSGPASIRLQSIQKRLTDFDWESFTSLL